MAALTRLGPRTRATARIAAAIAVVIATAATVGFGPLLRGIASVSTGPVVVAVALAAVATAAASWRWRRVAAAIGVPVGRADAFRTYYRSQFLNTVLPGGVVGDVHRAYAHGRSQGRLATAARAVAVERIAGQLVQGALTLAIVLSLGVGRALAPLAWIAGGVLAAVVPAVAAVAATRRGRALLRREGAMLRPLLARPATLVAIVGASAVVVVAHATTFVVAALAVGVPPDPGRLIPVAVIVLAGSAIPVGVGGWGPREAVSTAAFALAGLGAGTGLAVSTAFGVLTTIAVAPGALVLAEERIRSRARTRRSPRMSAGGGPA